MHDPKSADTYEAVENYLAELNAVPDGSEIQYRTPFQNLFEKVIPPHFVKNNIAIIQEDRHSGLEMDGTPDFFVYKGYGTLFSSLVGFVECKKPAYQLEKLIDSEQIKKYAKSCENIIITNYRRFILLQKGRKVHDFLLSKENKAILDFENLLRDFYSYDYPYIKTKKSLVSVLAAQSFYYSVALREFTANEKNKEESFFTKFNGLFSEYQQSINYHYELNDFCDIYSQSLVYGLMIARIDTGEKLDEKNLNYLQGIPSEYTLLYEFLSQAYEYRYLPVSIKVALTNIGKNINLIDITEVKKELANTDSGKQNIAVYLYEDFLQEYDNLRKTENRKEGGVYYTPSEAANFIVRSVNELIKTDFSLVNGYLSKDVKILDFACGTGTFLHSVFEQMLKENNDDLSREIIRDKIIKDIYGFEILFVPYIVAHTVLTRYLKENNVAPGDDRLGVYLTNTLDISQHSISSLLPSLKKEYERAMTIKDKEQILAIIGNPPYFNGKSKAKESLIDNELIEYKKDLNEKKINLDDLYIKFIRFAEWKIEHCKQGIVGIITNNSYLDGVTHRQMRKHLYNTFDRIYIVNLHGNTRKGEKDKNIFDIMVGVSIVIFVKLPNPAAKKSVKYFSTVDNGIISRQDKLSFLENGKIGKLKWTTLKPTEPYYWFVDKDFSLHSEYRKFWKVTDIFNVYGSGISTDRDDLVISYKKDILETNMKMAFSGSYSDEFKVKYNITNSSSYDFADKLQNQNFDKTAIAQTMYRPFDIRNIYYKIGFTSRPSEDVVRHFIKENIGLCFTRSVDHNIFSGVFIVDKPVDKHTINGQTYSAPLYLYSDKNYLKLEIETGEKTPNFTKKFQTFLQTLSFKPNPNKIMAYIYAVLHSTTYRNKYIEFLKTDFPAIPFTKDKAVFEKYAKLGQKLIDLHLLKNLPKDNKIKVGNVPQTDFIIDNFECKNDILFLHTESKQSISFAGVTSQIYNFEIGSYKPIEKWLKCRKNDGVSLCLQDLEHLRDMIISIKNTINIMREIEDLGDAFCTTLFPY